MALIRHTALNIFNNITSKISLKKPKKISGLDDAYLFSAITGPQ